jgi:hypothetical protein
MLNRHFSLQLLQQSATDPQISTYLRHRLTVVVWTRALLLGEHEVATKIAPEVVKIAPGMAPLVTEYLEAKNVPDREHAALYLLLKSPGLSPFLSSSLVQSAIDEDLDYYFESAWWCKPSETEYNSKGEEVRKTVTAAAFLDRQQIDTANHEYEKLVDVGNGNNYLGKQVLEWARSSPGDPRIAESLLIVFMANESYKYGCDGWSHDEEIQASAASLLHQRYPATPWTARLPKRDEQ